MGTSFRLLALFCLLAVGAAHGEVGSSAPLARDPLEEPRFESVGAGVIPRDVVAALAQDRAGLIWIATGDGLVRFDGYRFRAQERASDDPARRSLGWIRVLLPARDGRLWIGTETDGLAVYDPVTERVIDFGLGDALRDTDGAPALPTIRALAEDRDGRIWVGSLGGGVHRFDPVQKTFTVYRQTAEPGSLPDDRVQALLVDRRGTLWIGSWHGLSRLQPGSRQFEPVGGDSIGPQVQALHETSDGHIWAGSLHGVVAVVDAESGRARIVAGGSRSNSASRAAVTRFAEVNGGEMWVGRVSGIDIHDHQRQLVKQLRHDIRRPSGLAGNEVTALLLDRAGWLWVGGFGLGLQRHNPANRSIWVRGADLTPGSRLDGPSVRSILQIDNGEIWAASHRGGIAVMDDRLQVIGEVVPKPVTAATASTQATATAGRTHRQASSGAPTEAPQISAMAQTRDGSVWLGADNTVYRFSRDRKPLQTVTTDAGLTNFLLAGSDGSLWIGTMDGLHRLAPGAAAAVRVVSKPGQTPFTGAVHVLAEAPDRAVWIGSLNGLFRIPRGEQQMEAVESPAGQGLANSSVAGLLFDRDNKLWVDTGVTGLHRMTGWDGQRASFDRISARHGIVNKPFGANLLDDSRGRIWTQIHLYDPAADQLIALTTVDGADLGTGWFSSRTRTTDGRLLFGGSKGVMVVKPESFDVSDYAPPLLVSELRINGIPKPAGHVVADGLQIAPDQRSFSVEFAALDFSDPVRIRYAYRLDGFDSDWIQTGASSRLASYSNLDPGRYTLLLRATNRSGLWSPHQLAIDLRVMPAWWQQWWFRVIVLVLLATAVYGAIRLHTRRLRWRQQALEAKVAERTAELQRVSAALNESALTDPLTGLRNRRFLGLNIESDAALSTRAHETRLSQQIELASDADLIFFMFDIDHFKQVNDHFGHAAGDAVIVQTCARLKTIFRETDYLIRWGGEEFLVVARRTSRMHAVELAERARAAVATVPFDLYNGVLLDKSCSVGFACFPVSQQYPDALDWEEALNLADACLYAVKKAGRNGWLGVLDAHGDSIQAVREASRRPLAMGAGAGGLDTASSESVRNCRDTAS